jgi:hypothetical protein
MNGARDEQLERELAGMTRWEGEAPGLWRRALERAGAEPAGGTGRRKRPLHRRRIGWRVVAGAGIAALLIAAVPLAIGPSLGKPRAGTLEEHARASLSQRASEDRFRALAMEPGPPPPPPARGAAQPAPDGRPATAASAERRVVRRITLELEVADVRTAYLKTQHAVSPARGEFVAESSLRGEGAAARGSLTLRVAADRLSEALEELRTLGEVVSEQARGEDVTDQIVDLDARLRNEQRVEEELLRLMDTRADAPLKDVLELREQLGRVREQIERLAAQRERLDRLVALATVLVIISPADPDEPGDADRGASLWDGFTGALGQSWRQGVEVLIASVAWIVKVAVGGLLWWVLLAAAFGVLRHWYWRRAPGVA